MKTFSIIIFLILVLSNLSYSQINKERLPASKIKQIGVNYLQMGDTYSAIDYFDVYLKKKSTDVEIMYLLAECYRYARDYEKAKVLYKKTYDTKPDKYPEALYYYATMLKTEQKYDEALEHFNKFKKVFKKDKSESNLKRLTQWQIESCALAKAKIDSPLVVTITHLDNTINKASIEFSPHYIDNSQFIFASLRSDTALYVVNDSNLNVPKRKFYIGKKNNNTFTFIGEWNDTPFNKTNAETGNGVFSPDKQRFYFTRCEKNWKYQVICNIYKSSYINGKWSEPKPLPEIVNIPNYTTTQPAVGIDSKTQDEVLYFVSNRPGGRGGLDLWYTTYKIKKDTWTEPKNCGSTINSPADEVTPFIDNLTKSLYFSSNGFPGLGELDIFRAIGEKSSFTLPENIGFPINSPFDDLYYSISSNREDGFFTSNRTGTVTTMHPNCCDDIFAFRYTEIIKIGVEGSIYAIEDDIKEMMEKMFEQQTIIEDAQLTDEINSDSLKFIKGSVVSLFLLDKFSDNQLFIASDTTDEKGRFFFNLEQRKDYVVQFENLGRFNKKIRISTQNIEESDTLRLKPIGLNLLSKQPMTIKNIYYDFDKWELSNKAKRTIDTTLFKILKEVPQLVVEISSHTDSKGDDDYNKTLSQKRAESVVKYLIAKGIKPERLYAKGYGEEKPIAPNENPDGSDNPEGREKNRRTEFRIIGSLDQYSEIIYEE
ncbi:MAG: OmpA family protein [Bacteroidales bacterium]